MLKDTIKKLDEELFEEWAYQLAGNDCNAVFNHEVYWCGDCYACSKCGKRFIPADVANQALHHRDSAIIEAVREKIKGMKEEHPFCHDGCPEDGSTCSVLAKNEIIDDILSTLK